MKASVVNLLILFTIAVKCTEQIELQISKQYSDQVLNNTG